MSRVRLPEIKKENIAKGFDLTTETKLAGNFIKVRDRSVTYDVEVLDETGRKKRFESHCRIQEPLNFPAIKPDVILQSNVEWVVNAFPKLMNKRIESCEIKINQVKERKKINLKLVKQRENQIGVWKTFKLKPAYVMLIQRKYPALDRDKLLLFCQMRFKGWSDREILHVIHHYYFYLKDATSILFNININTFQDLEKLLNLILRTANVLKAQMKSYIKAPKQALFISKKAPAFEMEDYLLSLINFIFDNDNYSLEVIEGMLIGTLINMNRYLTAVSDSLSRLNVYRLLAGCFFLIYKNHQDDLFEDGILAKFLSGTDAKDLNALLIEVMDKIICFNNISYLDSGLESKKEPKLLIKPGRHLPVYRDESKEYERMKLCVEKGLGFFKPLNNLMQLKTELNEEGLDIKELAEAKKLENELSDILMVNGRDQKEKQESLKYFNETIRKIKEMRARITKRDVPEYLVRPSLDAYIQDKYLTKQEYTFLLTALIAKEEGYAKLLLEAGASPNVVNKDGETPLVMAFLKCSKGMVELLFEYKADSVAALNYLTQCHKKNRVFRNMVFSRIKENMDSFLLILDHASARQNIKNIAGLKQLLLHVDFQLPVMKKYLNILSDAGSYERQVSPLYSNPVSQQKKEQVNAARPAVRRKSC